MRKRGSRDRKLIPVSCGREAERGRIILIGTLIHRHRHGYPCAAPQASTNAKFHLPFGVASFVPRSCGCPCSPILASREVNNARSRVHRYYFHLTDGHKVIPDEVGIGVSDLEEVRAEAIKALRKFRRECSEADADWRGWRIVVTDAAGYIAFTIDLGSVQEGD